MQWIDHFKEKYPNFAYPKLILHKRSHDNIHPRCMPRNYLRSIIQMTYVCTSLAEKVPITQPAKEETTWFFNTLYYVRYCKNISQKLHRIFYVNEELKKVLKNWLKKYLVIHEILVVRMPRIHITLPRMSFFGCDLKIAKIEPRGSLELNTRAEQTSLFTSRNLARFTYSFFFLANGTTKYKKQVQMQFSFFLFWGKHARVLLTRLARTFYVNISDPLVLFPCVHYS